MEQLIIDYIFEVCQVKDNLIIFDGGKGYYDTLKKHLGDLFDLPEYKVDYYMISCFRDMDINFDYYYFMAHLKPPLIKMQSVCGLYYLDYHYVSDRELSSSWGAKHRNNDFNRFYAGIDPARVGGDITIGVSSRVFGELNHPDFLNDITFTRAIANQTFNLELIPLKEDLDE